MPATTEHALPPERLAAIWQTRDPCAHSADGRQRNRPPREREHAPPALFDRGKAAAVFSTTYQAFVVHHDDFRIPATHPSLAGHFPGNPVVPGVVVLDEIAAALRRRHDRRITGFSQVKFVAPLLPEQTALLQLELADERLRFRVLRDGVLIASGEAGTA